MVDYTAWVSEQAEHRVLLCDISMWNVNTDALETLLLSTHSAGDYQNYIPIIQTTPILRREIPRSLVGTLERGGGYIDLNIAGGDYDYLLYNNFANRLIVIKHGDASWVKADFQEVYCGYITRAEFINDTTMQVEFTDGTGFVDKPLTEELITNTDALDIPTPVCYGHCHNVKPILIDEASNRYKVSVGPVEDACFRLLYDGDFNAATVIKYNDVGEFRISSGTPSGMVTCDVRGQAPVADDPAYYKPGEIMEDMLITFGGLTAGDIDSAALTEYDSASPSQIGLYFPKRINLVKALNEAVKSHYGFFHFARNGKFTLEKFFGFVTPYYIINRWVYYESGSASISRITYIGTTLSINERDIGGTDKSANLDVMMPGDKIRLENAFDVEEWILLNIVSFVKVSDVYVIEVTEDEQGVWPGTLPTTVDIRYRGFQTESAQSIAKGVKATFDDTNIVGPIEIVHDSIKPTWKVDVGYEKNHTIIPEASQSKYADRLLFLVNEWRVSSEVSPEKENIKLRYADAAAPDLVKGNIFQVADADDEAKLRLDILYNQHYYIRFKSITKGTLVELGDVVEVTSDRFMLQDTKVRVMSIDDDLLTGITEVGGWLD